MKEVQGVAGEKMANVTTRGTQKFVGAVENAISILRFLTHDYAASGVARIARETGINVSTTFNILRTLANEGLISMNPSTKEYSPGLGLLEFSVPLLGTNQIDLLHPVLEQLSVERRALIGLWKVTPHDRIVLVDRVVEGKTVRVDMALGSRLPALAGGGPLRRGDPPAAEIGTAAPVQVATLAERTDF